MRIVSSSLFFALAIGVSSQAHAVAGYNFPLFCAPPAGTTTMTVVDAAFAKTAKLDAFAHASALQQIVTEKDDVRVKRELTAIGVDPKAPRALFAFVGARDKANHYAAATKHLGISPEQARVLVDAVAAALMGFITSGK